jgi:hypothetical protein
MEIDDIEERIMLLEATQENRTQPGGCNDEFTTAPVAVVTSTR